MFRIWYWYTIYTTLFLPADLYGWGFTAHREINQQAIFLLPTELQLFYKAYRVRIKENAVNPDKRCYAVDKEPQRHFIDLEYYTASGEPPPHRWREAKVRYPKADRKCHGILPWYIIKMKARLTRAFARRDVQAILRHSEDIAHYIADAHVPLHTSVDYDGEKQGLVGIHSFWETRLVELFKSTYNYFVGPATYISNPTQAIWETIYQSHALVVLLFSELKRLNKDYPAWRRYAFARRGVRFQRVPTAAYAKAYHDVLQGQVEEQLRKTIHMVASFWYTCWVDGGKPDLRRCMVSKLADLNYKPEDDCSSEGAKEEDEMRD